SGPSAAPLGAQRLEGYLCTEICHNIIIFAGTEAAVVCPNSLLPVSPGVCLRARQLSAVVHASPRGPSHHLQCAVRWQAISSRCCPPLCLIL
uniref:Uncharacterized protein n=1 Tax=Castor canadensis TaxID=51338 RepID=A0A8C0WM60_CASCN